GVLLALPGQPLTDMEDVRLGRVISRDAAEGAGQLLLRAAQQAEVVGDAHVTAPLPPRPTRPRHRAAPGARAARTSDPPGRACRSVPAPRPRARPPWPAPSGRWAAHRRSAPPPPERTPDAARTPPTPRPRRDRRPSSPGPLPP